MFSDAFSEGQLRDINEDFPTGSSAEVYDYLSDSDLEAECSSSEEECAESTEGDSPELLPRLQTQESSPQTPTTKPLEQAVTDANEVQDDNHLGHSSSRMGKVAIVRDMAAITYANPMSIDPRT